MKTLLITLFVLSGCSDNLYCVDGKIYTDTAVEGNLREVELSKNYRCKAREHTVKAIERIYGSN